jgi:ppGpp synthetase/RelA/SpoT-type nucleotidyltranferase
VPSKRSIDRLGDRLRRGEATDTDLQELEAWRQSFRPGYEAVNEVLARLRWVVCDSAWDLFQLSQRPAKTTESIVAKLQRMPSARLSQMQDIAGCRVVVFRHQQDAMVDAIRGAFEKTKVDDLRLTPSHGYKAVHVLVYVGDRTVEVQVRNGYENYWALASERLADAFGQEVKYGGGPHMVRGLLHDIDDFLQRLEDSEPLRARSATAEEIAACMAPWGVTGEGLVRMVSSIGSMLPPPLGPP